MTYQNISAEVNAADLQVIKDALGTIRQKLPFLVNLTKAERKSLYKTGASRLSFVQNAKTVAQNNPGVLPAIFDGDQFASNVNLFAVLTELTTMFKQLVSQCDDTRVAVGAASLAGASQVHKYVQIGVKTTPGLRPLADQLGKAFTRSIQKAPPSPPQQTGNDAFAPRPVLLDDRNVTGDTLSMTVDDRSMAVDRQSMTVDDPSMTVDDPSMTVDGQNMTIDGQNMTVDGPSMTVDGPSMTVDGPSMTVDGPSMTVDDPSMTVDDPSMTLDDPSMTVDASGRNRYPW